MVTKKSIETASRCEPVGLQVKPSPPATTPSAIVDEAPPLNELQVYQIELAMPNEALHQAQTELEASRDRYVDLYEFAPVGYLSLDADGLVVEINLTCTKLLQLERHQVLRECFAHLVITEDQERWNQLFLNVKGGKGKVSLELVLKRGDGIVFDARIDATGGTFAGLAVLHIAITDISELKKVESRLRQRELELSAVIESEPECVKQLARDGSLLQMNRAGLNMIEADSLDQVVGRPVSALVAPQHREAFDALTQQVFLGKAGVLVFEITGLKGTHRWLESHAVPLRDADGNITSALSITRDITEGKQMKLALEASEERFRTVADYTLDWEYWDGPQQELLYMSPSCEGMTGYTREEFFADPSLLIRITHPEDVALLQRHRLELDKAEDGALEYRIVHRDGSVRWIEHGCHPVHSADGKFRGRRVSNRNVTERKKAEARANDLLHVAQRTYGLILAGGRGTRLKQLTDGRSKPAVPFGGKLKIIDFSLSNCVNSGIRRVGVLTQYKAQSLIRHIEHGWGFLESSLNEYIDVVPAQQQVNAGWYSGTADAVYQNLSLLDEADPSYVLILAGDHIYKMDYTRILADHVNSSADLTVACIELPIAEVSGFGVMAVDNNARVTAFEEKPIDPTPIPGNPGFALASMGIYVFSSAFLREQLRQDAADEQSSHDFGRDLIPRLIHSHHVQAHRFADSCVNMIQGRPYWRDVGTVDAYWEANIDLTHVVPDLNMYDDDWPILSLHERAAPAKFVFRDPGLRGMALDSLVSSGCIVSGATVRGSVLFTKVRVAEYSLIEDSVLLPEVVVGRNVILKRAVVDNGCIIPDGFQAGVNPDADRTRFHVTPRGITLITPEMLGQLTHRVA